MASPTPGDGTPSRTEESSTETPEQSAKQDLGTVAETPEIAGITVEGRRRRPAGDRQPLFKKLLPAGTFWLLALLLVAATWVLLYASNAADPLVDGIDRTVTSWLV